MTGDVSDAHEYALPNPYPLTFLRLHCYTILA